MRYVVDVESFGTPNGVETVENREKIAGYNITYGNNNSPAAGQVISIEYVNKMNQAIQNEKGWSKLNIEHDKNGNPIQCTFTDANGHPCIHKDGYSHITMSYDGHGNRTKIIYHPTNNNNYIYINGILQNYVQVLWKYDNHGNIIEESYQESNGQAGNCHLGYSSVTRQYDEKNRKEIETYYDKDGKLRTESTGHAQTTWKYDEYGNKIEEIYYTKNPTSCSPKSCHHCIKRKYDKYGNMIEEALYDNAGKPSTKLKGYAREVVRYNNQGNWLERTFYGDDGKLLSPVKDSVFFKNGLACLRAGYDERGNLNKISLHNRDGDPCSLFGWSSKKKIFDDCGREIEIAYYDSQGKLCETAEPNPENASTVFSAHFDTWIGFSTSNADLASYDALRIPSYARRIIQYDDRGRISEITYYDKEGNLSSQGNYARIKNQYSTNGKLLNRIYYDHKGTMLNTPSQTLGFD